MDFWERLDHEIERAPGVRTRKALAQMAGFNVGNFGAWKSRSNYPSAPTLVHMASILGTTVEYLITGQSPSVDPWALTHQDFINDIKILPAEQQAFIINAAKGEADRVRALQNASLTDSAPST